VKFDEQELCLLLERREPVRENGRRLATVSPLKQMQNKP